MSSIAAEISAFLTRGLILLWERCLYRFLCRWYCLLYHRIDGGGACSASVRIGTGQASVLRWLHRWVELHSSQNKRVSTYWMCPTMGKVLIACYSGDICLSRHRIIKQDAHGV